MAKTFNLNVRFSGLLHYVENADRKRGIQLCIVLPEAPNHLALIRPMSGCAMTLEGEPQLCRELSGNRVAFEPAWDNPVRDRSFDFERAVMTGEPLGAVPLEAMIQDRADKNPSIVGLEGLAESNVRSQILIGKEAIFTVPETNSPPKMRFGNGKVAQMAPFVLMQLEGLTSFRIGLLPLEAKSGDSPSFLDIEPEGEETVNLSISHFCRPKKGIGASGKDEDFVYHYGLLMQRKGMAILEAEDRFPLPELLSFVDDDPSSDFEDNLSGQVQAQLANDDNLSANLEDFLSKQLFLEKLCSKKGFYKHHTYDYSRTGCNCAPARGLPRPFNLDQAFGEYAGQAVRA